MSGIVCAIRGGPASKSTLSRAIELAQARQQPLYLLYVVNLHFLVHTAHSRIAAIQEEMREMGELILFMAQETATAANVIAHPEVREGKVEAQIIALCVEVGAEVVVVGEPLPGRTTAAFSGEKLDRLRAQLKEQCGAELILVP